MLYSNSLDETRQVFYSSWQKHNDQQPLSALEQQIVNVLLDHPEYHAIMEKGYNPNAPVYSPEKGETNPFLHLGLHLAIRDQLATNRPLGIIDIFQNLLIKYVDPLVVEHLLMENLAKYLWNAQKSGCPYDEASYWQSINRLS